MATKIENCSHPPGTMVLDRNGDVLFELGSGSLTAHLLVSSKVLSLASSVFCAMFTHGFSEGEGLSSSAPRLIPLPDENPPAMALLCHILHFRTSAIPMERDVAALAELAILCDKYDCAGSVKPWSLLWIAEWLPCVGQDGFEKLLFITYGLDLPDAFSKVTKALVESHHGQLQFDDTSSGYEILPEGLTDDIEREREKLRSGLSRAFDAAISPLIPLANHPCMGELVGSFYFKLYTAGLWPFSEKLAETSLSDISTKVSRLALPTFVRCRNYNYSCVCYSGENGDAKGVGPNLKQKIQEVTNSITGICLDCTKRSGGSVDHGECRVPH